MSAQIGYVLARWRTMIIISRNNLAACQVWPADLLQQMLPFSQLVPAVGYV